MKLLIFDIDGTLTHLDGATRRAFDSAYVRLFGRNAAIAGIKMHGRTDPLIFRDCYHESGLGEDWQDAYNKFRDVYIAELPAAIAARKDRVRLHPGVEELVTQLAVMPERAALALGTGNMEAGGRTKIATFGLNDFFPVGGFGDVHHERVDILRDAVLSAERHWNRRFDPQDTWVIGDTPYDIEGGKALGLRTLGVATGGAFSLADLVNTHPDAVFADLSDTEMVLAVFGLN
ncbi:HAD hydrolase-like protein [bacterium]|nr:HAD hydrolase-like protein [bacterium]MBU1983207.1 HAD hydrolase-like protein [bacterium]